MTIALQPKYLLFLLVGLDLTGQAFMATLSEQFGWNSNIYSILMRALLFSSALALIFFMMFIRGRFEKPPMVYALILFWGLYLIRLVSDTLLSGKELSQEPYVYWAWAVGGCIVPMIGLLVANRYSYYDDLYRLCYALFFVSAVLVALKAHTTATDSLGHLVETGRLNLSKLNPVSLGYLGLSLLNLSIWPILYSKRIGTLWHIHRIIAFLVGLYLMLASNSRGPFICFALMIMFFVMVTGQKSAFRMSGKLILLAAFALPPLLYFHAGLTHDISQRVSAGFNGGDESITLRFQSYSGAISQFASSPFFGSGLEESTTLCYPHNVILESFMATGIIGGMLFIFIVLSGMYASVRILRSKSVHGWIAMLFIQNFIAAQFAGSIWESTTMWIMYVLLIMLLNFELCRKQSDNVSEAFIGQSSVT
jgi:O-antigen ligase